MTRQLRISASDIHSLTEAAFFARFLADDGDSAARTARWRRSSRASDDEFRLANDLTEASRLARALAHALDVAVAVAGVLDQARILDRALDRACALDRVCADARRRNPDPDLARAFAGARDLDGALERLRARDRSLPQ